ncbi:MAG TPA: enoyl-CoA hydratase-related protein [Acidimicrobiales bacterium]|nr:enoyl-CoA hydratase-related protein [Acidimicrobiales bacterium]
MERKVTTYEVDEGVALVRLARPERLNAWTARMELEYRAALAEADADPDVRAVVLTGSGRGFCAGADTKALTGIVETGRYGSGTSSEADDAVPFAGHGIRPDFEHGFSYPYGLRKPLIAAINGPAAGVGFVLACFADIRFAAAGAKLTTSFGRLGLPAEHGVSWVLSRLVGTARAADLLFSSRVVLAEEAERMGLVNAVLPPDELMGHTMDYAKRMAAEISPWSLLALKRQLYADQLRSLDEAATDAELLMAESFGTPDFKEGVAALTEKRPPSFGGLA